MSSFVSFQIKSLGRKSLIKNIHIHRKTLLDCISWIWGEDRKNREKLLWGPWLRLQNYVT